VAVAEALATSPLLTLHSMMEVNILISHNVFLKLVCSSQLTHKFVNLSFISTDMENKVTDLCGNGLLQNDFEDTLCDVIKSKLATVVLQDVEGAEALAKSLELRQMIDNIRRIVQPQTLNPKP
jgi:hypothetical protein